MLIKYAHKCKYLMHCYLQHSRLSFTSITTPGNLQLRNVLSNTPPLWYHILLYRCMPALSTAPSLYFYIAMHIAQRHRDIWAPP